MQVDFTTIHAVSRPAPPAGSSSFSAELTQAFEIVDDWYGYKDAGVMSLRISGEFICACDSHADFVQRLKAMLPPDARVIAPDGQPIRLAASRSGYGADHWVMLFASHEWPKGEEGSLIPELRPLFVAPQLAAGRAQEIEIIECPPDNVGIELRINRRTHILVIPKNRETEDQCVVEVRPKQ